MKTTRREFIRTTGIVFAGATFSAPLLAAQDKPKERRLHKAIMYGTIGHKGSVLEKFQAMKAAGFEQLSPTSARPLSPVALHVWKNRTLAFFRVASRVVFQ